MHFDELLGDAESESSASELAGNRRVRLLELGKQTIDMLSGNADPGVRHAEAKRVVEMLDGDLDPPLLGELERVAGQIREALHEALAVAVGQRKVSWNRRHELQALF